MNEEAYSLRIATGLPSEPTSATRLDSPILAFCSSSIASTIGTDMLTTDPSSRRSELKWRVWRNSDSLMKPPSGLAQPSLSTCIHCTSIAVSSTRGRSAASCFFSRRRGSATTSSTSFPPSGEMSPARVTPPRRCDLEGKETVAAEKGRSEDGDLERGWERKGDLLRTADMEAIEGSLSQASELRFERKCFVTKFNWKWNLLLVELFIDLRVNKDRLCTPGL